MFLSQLHFSKSTVLFANFLNCSLQQSGFILYILMAGTSILATICAERMAKFLTRYSRSHLSKIRCRITPVEAMREVVKADAPTVYVNPVERKYALWQPAQYQSKTLVNIFGCRLARSSGQPQRILVPETRSFIADIHKPKLQPENRQILRQLETQCQPGRYTSLLQKNLTFLKSSGDLFHHIL